MGMFFSFKMTEIINIAKEGNSIHVYSNVLDTHYYMQYQRFFWIVTPADMIQLWFDHIGQVGLDVEVANLRGFDNLALGDDSEEASNVMASFY